MNKKKSRPVHVVLKLNTKDKKTQKAVREMTQPRKKYQNDNKLLEGNDESQKTMEF